MNPAIQHITNLVVEAKNDSISVIVASTFSEGILASVTSENFAEDDDHTSLLVYDIFKQLDGSCYETHQIKFYCYNLSERALSCLYIQKGISYDNVRIVNKDLTIKGYEGYAIISTPTGSNEFFRIRDHWLIDKRLGQDKLTTDTIFESLQRKLERSATSVIIVSDCSGNIVSSIDNSDHKPYTTCLMVYDLMKILRNSRDTIDGLTFYCYNILDVSIRKLVDIEKIAERNIKIVVKNYSVVNYQRNTETKKVSIMDALYNNELPPTSKNFTKDDKSKLRYDLIPTEVTESLAKVLTMGANKYAVDNWKKCTDQNRIIAALMRHLEAHRSGEIIDSESGFSHMAHVLTNAAFITYFIENNNDAK